MNRAMLAMACPLLLAGAALAQAGVEGQEDLLYPDRQPPSQTPRESSRGSASTLAMAHLPTAMHPAPVKLGIESAPKASGQTRAPSSVPVLPPAVTAEECDFGEVLRSTNASVAPLQAMVDEEFGRFAMAMAESDRLMRQGRVREGLLRGQEAIDDLLRWRDQVARPLWEGQTCLLAESASVRARLGESLDRAAGSINPGQPEAGTARTLDGLARRIATTHDPARRERLSSQYRMIRALDSFRSQARDLTPDRRRLWLDALGSLERASESQLRILMGCESMFAQLDATSRQVQDLLQANGTVSGLNELVGTREQGGMAALDERMAQVRGTMQGFATTLDGALQVGVDELDERVRALQSSTEDAAEGGRLPGTTEDDELQARIRRVGTGGR